MLRKAFTLIELLVVIAIIAILAAILFPVFAQAKIAAKKSVTISNCKQWGTGITIYMTDHDDLMPFAQGVRPPAAGNNWFVNGLHPYPANANNAAPWDDPLRRQQQAGLHWSNSCHPYTKNFDMTGVPVANARATAGDVLTPGVSKNEPALSMNGFMHTMSSSEINAPSSAIMMWTGRGNVAGVNRTLSTPTLGCTVAAPAGQPVSDCRFNSGGYPQSGSATAWSWTGDFSGGGSVWTFERQCVFVRMDTSTKVRPAGRDAVAGIPAPPAPTLAQALNDPYLRVDVNGTVPAGAWIVNCSVGSGPGYWCYFRPDRD